MAASSPRPRAIISAISNSIGWARGPAPMWSRFCQAAAAKQSPPSSAPASTSARSGCSTRSAAYSGVLPFPFSIMPVAYGAVSSVVIPAERSESRDPNTPVVPFSDAGVLGSRVSPLSRLARNDSACKAQPVALASEGKGLGWGARDSRHIGADRRSAAAGGRRPGAGAAWPAQHVRLLCQYRRAVAFDQRAGGAARPRRLSARKVLGAGDLGRAAGRRAAARARPVHAHRRGADSRLPHRDQCRALARRPLFLEPARPRIHADVDDRGAVFPRARRRDVLARSPLVRRLIRGGTTQFSCR